MALKRLTSSLRNFGMLESHMARIITIFSGMSGFARLPVPVYKSNIQSQLSNKPVKIQLARPEMVGSYWALKNLP